MHGWTIVHIHNYIRPLQFFSVARLAVECCDTIDAQDDSVVVVAFAVVIVIWVAVVHVARVGMVLLVITVLFCFGTLSIMICKQSAVKTSVYNYTIVGHVGKKFNLTERYRDVYNKSSGNVIN